MDDLTDQQQKLYNYLKLQIKNNGYPPSIREMCVGVGLRSTSTVHLHLKALEAKKYIKRNNAKSRTIEILDTSFYSDSNDSYIEIPVIGTVTAGVPILASENIETTFPIPINYIGRDEIFMLRIKGDSMINKSINNGDLVIVNKQSTANNGDIVVALIEDEATVKTYYKENNHYRLQPENDNYEPIIVNSLQILGKVKGLYRWF